MKRPSDDQTKYDLFQRLNAGGTQANAQELRNCIILMINKDFFAAVSASASDLDFKTVTAASESQIEKQRHMELATRFLVHTNVIYDGKLDVEEYIDDGIIQLAKNNNTDLIQRQIRDTFRILNLSYGSNALRRFESGQHGGKVGLVGLECIAVGIAKNIGAIARLNNDESIRFVQQRIREFWSQSIVESFLSPGLRGTIRIQRTVPFGTDWFKP